MTIDRRAQFIEHVAQAKIAAIGGVLNKDTEIGLSRTGLRTGMTLAEVEKVIAETKAARYAPRTTDQWKD